MQIHKFFTGVYGLISLTYGEALTPLQKLELTYNFSREVGNKVDTFRSCVRLDQVESLAERVGTDLETFAESIKLATIGKRVYLSPKIFRTIEYCIDNDPKGEYRGTVYNTLASHPVLAIYAAFQAVYFIQPDKSVLEKIKFALQFINMLNIRVFVKRRKAPATEIFSIYQDYKEVTLCESEKDFMYGIGCQELTGDRFNITSRALEAVRCCLDYHLEITNK